MLLTALLLFLFSQGASVSAERQIGLIDYNFHKISEIRIPPAEKEIAFDFVGVVAVVGRTERERKSQADSR